MTGYVERSISGKQILITGATNGIGKEIARALARRGANITVIARSEGKASETIRELSAEAGADGALAYVIGDLADLTSIRSAAAEIAERHSSIDVLINNAGIHSFASDITVDGYELMMATNRLGPFLLTNLLLDRLESAAPSRIVVTASEVRESRLLTVARRAASASPFIGRPEQGARLGIRLVLAAELADNTGAFFTSTPGLRFLPKVRARSDDELQRLVWNRSAELVGLAKAAS